MRRRARRGNRQDVRIADLSVKILLPLWLALAALMTRAVMYFHSQNQLGVDSHAYWLAGRHSDLYTRPPMMRDAYLYSPAFKQLIWPLAQLPWPVFYAVWVIAESAAFVWLLRPLGWAWGVPAFLVCGFEIIAGNIMGFLAVALVVGMRRPQAWAFPALTKIAVCLGPLWFVARREYGALLRIVAATAVVVAVSVAIDATAWGDWLRFLAHHSGSDASLPYRLVAAVAIVVVAARLNQPWLLAPAMVLASPVLHGVVQYLMLLAAIPRLRRLPAQVSVRSRALVAVPVGTKD